VKKTLNPFLRSSQEEKEEEMNRARTEGITFTKEPFMEDTGPRKM